MAVYVVTCTYERVSKAEVDIEFDDLDLMQDLVSEMDDDDEIVWTQAAITFEYSGRLEA